MPPNRDAAVYESGALQHAIHPNAWKGLYSITYGLWRRPEEVLLSRRLKEALLQALQPSFDRSSGSLPSSIRKG